MQRRTAAGDQDLSAGFLFVAADAAGQPLLDDLAVGERWQRQQIAVDSAKQVAISKPADPSRTGDCAKLRWKAIDRSTGFINGLCADDAPYYSKIGDPPETEIFRKALALIGDLANASLALADGTTAQPPPAPGGNRSCRTSAASLELCRQPQGSAQPLGLPSTVSSLRLRRSSRTLQSRQVPNRSGG